MLVGTLTNILVKKLLGKKFIPRFAKYLIKFPYYETLGSGIHGVGIPGTMKELSWDRCPAAVSMSGCASSVQ